MPAPTAEFVDEFPDDDPSDIDYSRPAILPDDEHLAERVEWHVRMARQATAELEEVKSMYERELERIKERIQNRVRIIQERIAWHTAPVQSYHTMRQAQEPKRKTIEFPHGASKITVPTTPVVQFDPSEGSGGLVKLWLRSTHPEMLKLPGITDVRSLVHITTDDDGNHIVIDKATGEIVPGLVAEIPAPTYKLTVERGSPL